MAKRKSDRQRERAIEKANRRRARIQARGHREQLNSPDVFTRPQGYGAINQQADVATRLRYGGQEQQLALQQRQVPAWFDQYRASLQTPAQVAQTYQPALQQVQANQQETAKPTAGIDPNSQAGQQDALAAKAREALVGLGAATLTAGQAADTTYAQGRAGVANAAQIGAQAQLGSQATALAGEKGAYRDQYVTDARERERAYGLAAQHQAVENKAFNVDTAVKFEDVKTDRQKIKQTAKTNRQKQKAEGQKVNSYGYSNEQWARFSPSHRRRIIAQDKAAGKSPAAKKPGYTTEQHHNAKISLRKSIALVKKGLKQPNGRDPGYWQSAYDQLVADGVDPAIARAAVRLVRPGRKVGPGIKRTLKDDYGIHHLPKVKKAKPAPGTNSGGGGGPEGSGRTTASKASLSRYSPDTNKESAIAEKRALTKAYRRRGRQNRTTRYGSKLYT